MIVEAMKGYRAADLPKDAVAGLVIAALSIPIAMGYAEVVGLPAIYGLWASIVAPLAFGLLTGTRRVVFGMDSAAAAMTASMLAAAGIAAQGQDAIVSAMPLLTLLTALFLLLLGWAGAGRLIRRMPLRSCTGSSSASRSPWSSAKCRCFWGTTADTSGAIVSKVVAIVSCLPAPRGPAPWCRLSASLACIS